MANTAYRAPGVTGTTTSTVQTAISPGARYMALIGRSGKGPDIPTVYTNIQAAYAAYGSPGASGELPWGIAAAMGGTPTGASGAPCIICRVGVTRASLALVDVAPITWATIYAKGTYAGTAGNGANTPVAGLYAQVTAGTTGGTKKIIITQGTGGSAVTLSTYDNITLPSDLVSAATNDPYIDVSPGASVVVPVTVASTALAGGLDGLTAVPADSGTPWAAQLTMLFSGMVPAPRYFCCLYDATGIYATAQAAITAALANSPAPTPALAYLGSKLGTSIATSASLAATINTIQAVLWGMPGATRYDPTLNTNRAFDGFYQAATLMAVKAALGPQYTGINQPLPGWIGNMPIATTAGVYRLPTAADVLTLGQNGASYGLSGPGINGLQVINHLTTGQVYGTNYAWQQLAGMLDCHHHAQVAAYTAANGFTGQPAPAGSDLRNAISNRLNAALKRLVGTVIASVNSITTVADPATVGRYLPSINYDLSPEVMNIDIQFAVGYQP